MLKYLSDKLVVYLATKFGFPDEDLAKEKEVMELKKELLKAQMSNSKEMKRELVELKLKVEELTEEKIAKLEYENERLRFENKQMNLMLGKPSNNKRTGLLEPEIDLNFIFEDGIVDLDLEREFKEVIPHVKEIN